MGFCRVKFWALICKCKLQKHLQSYRCKVFSTSVADFKAILCSKSLIIMCKPGCSKFEYVGKRHAKLQKLKGNKGTLTLSSVFRKGDLLSWLLIMCCGHLEPLYSQIPWVRKDKTQHTSCSSLLFYIVISHQISFQILYFNLMPLFITT